MSRIANPEVIEAINDLGQAWGSCVNANDAEGIGEYVTDDVEFQVTGVPTGHGRGQYVSLYKSIFAQSNAMGSCHITIGKLDIIGDDSYQPKLVVATGKALAMVTTHDGQSHEMPQQFCITCVKDDRGYWKVRVSTVSLTIQQPSHGAQKILESAREGAEGYGRNDATEGVCVTQSNNGV